MQSVRCTLAYICPLLQRGPDRTFTVESSTCSRQTDQSVYRNVFSPDASHVPINGNRAILPASVLNLSKFRARRMEKIATSVPSSAHLFANNRNGSPARFPATRRTGKRSQEILAIMSHIKIPIFLVTPLVFSRWIIIVSSFYIRNANFFDIVRCDISCE